MLIRAIRDKHKKKQIVNSIAFKLILELYPAVRSIFFAAGIPLRNHVFLCKKGCRSHRGYGYAALKKFFA